MKNLKLKGTLAVGLLSLTTLVGCGGTSNVSSENTITFWHTFSKSIQNILNRKIESFEKYIQERDGVEINIEQSPRGDYDSLAEAIIKGYAVGSTPTLTVAYPDNVAYYLGLETNPGDFVVKLDDFFEDPELGFAADKTLNPNGEGTDDIVTSFFEEGQNYMYEGTYSLPFMKSSEIMLYNVDVVTQALTNLGIQQGADVYMSDITWNELMAICEEIAAKPEEYGLDTNLGDAYPLYYDSDANFFITQSYQRNIPFISMNEEGVGSIDFNNPQAVALINEFKDLHDRKILTTKGVENKYGSDFFKAMKSVFVVGSTGGSGYSDPGVSFDVGVCKFPVYDGISADRAKYVSQGVTLCLLNNSSDSAEVNDKKVRYGWEFMKYLLNTTNNIDLCLSSEGYIPVRESCYEDEAYQAYLNEQDYMSIVGKTVIEEINGNYFNYPVFQGSDTAREEVEGAVKNTLLGTRTAEENLKIAYDETIKDMR